jgi:RNA polymerase sigma-70 factor, ECF subfamily
MKNNASACSEGELIAAILAGETQLYHELIRPCEHSVYMMALSLIKNHAEAEDVAQEAFVRAFRHLSSFRGESKFSTWVITIALNEARRRLRRRAVVTIESLDEPESDDRPFSPALLPDWHESPSEAVERQEVRAMLQEAVANLPLIYREVFALRAIEELSVNDTAEALNISVPAVKIRLHRARMMLQRQLALQLKTIAKTSKRRWLPRL